MTNNRHMPPEWRTCIRYCGFWRKRRKEEIIGQPSLGSGIQTGEMGLLRVSRNKRRKHCYISRILCQNMLIAPIAMHCYVNGAPKNENWECFQIFSRLITLFLYYFLCHYMALNSRCLLWNSSCSLSLHSLRHTAIRWCQIATAHGGHSTTSYCHRTGSPNVGEDRRVMAETGK